MDKETESIEDILRHDAAHDEWHASHGDPPCTSEADCARMQAGYNEESMTVQKLRYLIAQGGHVGVVAEEILAKADGSAHPHAHEQSSMAFRHSAKANESGSKEHHDKAMEAHFDAANAHEDLARKAEASGDDEAASESRKKAGEHRKFAFGHSDKKTDEG